jgi:hypothetical protein
MCGDEASGGLSTPEEYDEEHGMREHAQHGGLEHGIGASSSIPSMPERRLEGWLYRTPSR